MSNGLNAAAAVIAASLLTSSADAQTKLLPYPDIGGDRIAFCYAGDVWTVAAKGGTASRLTAHPGVEQFPKFSLDGGNATVPLSGTNDVDGSWVIEGHGVDPDIVVENDPKSVIAGRDPQLERAVEELVRKMDAEPMRLPKKPADPVKTK